MTEHFLSCQVTSNSWVGAGGASQLDGLPQIRKRKKLSYGLGHMVDLVSQYGQFTRTD